MKNIITILLIAFTVTICKAQINVRKYEKKGVTLKEIQQAIEYNLSQIKMNEPEYYFIPDPPLTKQHYFYNYFTEKAKLRMVELFEGKWTEEEIESRINASIKSTLDTLNLYNGYYKDAKKIANRDSLPLLRVWDSMIVARKKEWGEDLLKEDKLRADGFFYVDVVKKKWTEHQLGIRNWQYQLWPILMFQLWLEGEK